MPAIWKDAFLLVPQAGGLRGSCCGEIKAEQGKRKGEAGAPPLQKVPLLPGGSRQGGCV